MKGIVEGRTGEALTGAGADGAGVDGDDDANGAGADEVVGSMMEGMEGGTMPEESAMGVFLSPQLIRYDSNAPSIDRYS